MKGIGKLTIENLRSAFWYGILTSLFIGAVYVVHVGDIFAIDFHKLINLMVLGLLEFFISIVKNFFTTSSGTFLGMKVIPTIESKEDGILK